MMPANLSLVRCTTSSGDIRSYDNSLREGVDMSPAPFQRKIYKCGFTVFDVMLVVADFDVL